MDFKYQGLSLFLDYSPIKAEHVTKLLQCSKATYYRYMRDTYAIPTGKLSYLYSLQEAINNYRYASVRINEYPNSSLDKMRYHELKGQAVQAYDTILNLMAHCPELVEEYIPNV